MVSQSDFAVQVADAYERLHDLVYLRTHPLTELLAPSPNEPLKKQARHIHQILLDLVAELDPGPQARAFSVEWRRHRLMQLRSVDGLSAQAVADHLSVSLRHYYRLQEAAVADVAGILWHRYIVRPAQVSGGHPQEEAEEGRLALFRSEAARMARADRYARLREVTDGVVAVLKKVLVQHNLDVQLQLAEELPAVSVGQGLLRQALLATLGYLVERARDATLRVSAETQDSAVLLTVAVEPPAALRVTSSEEVTQHLSTVAEFALLSGTQISPIRTEERVAGFALRFPPVERTVLVVDDNEDMLQLFTRYLTPHNYQVLVASKAQDAIEKAARFQPSVITLDLMMPQQDGWDLLQVLQNRADTRQIPVMVCSVLQQRELALSLGATAFLEKPITEGVLLTALKALGVP